MPALTIYRKRAVNVETERKPKSRTTEITADEFYVAVVGFKLDDRAGIALGDVYKRQRRISLPTMWMSAGQYLSKSW